MRKITRLACAVTLAATLAFETPAAFAQPADVVYTTTALNLRAGPTARSERMLTMPPSAITYLVACESNAWCQIEYVTPQGYLVTGYAHSGYLSFVPPGARRPRYDGRRTGAVVASRGSQAYGAPMMDDLAYDERARGEYGYRSQEYVQSYRQEGGVVLYDGDQPIYYSAPPATVLARYVSERGMPASTQGVYDGDGVWHPLVYAARRDVAYAGSNAMQAGPIAECKDGSYDDGHQRRSTCALRGGVLRWIR